MQKKKFVPFFEKLLEWVVIKYIPGLKLETSIVLDVPLLSSKFTVKGPITNFPTTSLIQNLSDLFPVLVLSS